MSTRRIERAVVGILFLAVAPSLLAQEVQFRKRSMQTRDVTKQSIRYDLDAERTIRQQNQIVDRSKHGLVRQQERVLTVLGLTAGQPTHVSISFPTSKTKVQLENEGTTEVAQPVEGNTYLVEVRNGEMIITDGMGAAPSKEELEIVRMTLETLGKPNPLAAFLHGKKIRVGQTIVVPKEVARELLGQTASVDGADQLTLKLTSLTQIDGQRCGVFSAMIRADNRQLGATSLLMRGSLAVEVDSCRTRSMSLQGPVATSEVRGPKEGRFIVSTNGVLQLAIKSSYDSAKR
jgi:hypothetical protein